MIQLFFPKMNKKINSTNSMQENRIILAAYFDKNIFLWMFWSLFFMIYINCQEVYFFREAGTDIVISQILHYAFLFQSFIAVSLVKILNLTEKQADALCKAIRGNEYKD